MLKVYESKKFDIFMNKVIKSLSAVARLNSEMYASFYEIPKNVKTVTLITNKEQPKITVEIGDSNGIETKGYLNETLPN